MCSQHDTSFQQQMPKVEALKLKTLEGIAR